MTSHVTTARGRTLNLDQLISASKRPLNYEEPASEIPAPEPVKPVALNMRGYMPAQSTEPLPANPHAAPNQTPVSNPTVVEEKFQRPVDTRSLADLTEIKIDQAKTIKVRPGAKVQPGDGARMAEETLSRMESGRPRKNPKGSVLDDLDDATGSNDR